MAKDMVTYLTTEKLCVWVPTDIGLPPCDDEYIVTCRGAKKSMSLSYEDGEWTNGEHKFDVVAWMPFPEVCEIK